MPWILANGLHCCNSEMKDPDYVEIGNPDLIEKRQHRAVPVAPGGRLSDYVPFYFTPYSPMLYNIKTGWNGMPKRPMSEIVILVSSLRVLQEQGVAFVFSDRHAYLLSASFFNDLDALTKLDWKIWQTRDFRRDPNDPEKMARYQAEALAHRRVPVSGLQGVVCHGKGEEDFLRQSVQDSGTNLTVHSRSGWYV